MSLRLAPKSSHPTSTTNTTTHSLTSTKSSSSSSSSTNPSAPSAPGLHDTLRSNTSPTTQITSSHPLESRLANWTATQESTRANLLRRTYGIAEPLRRGMELKMVRDSDSFRPSVLGAPGRVHEQILSGRDGECTWEDVYDGQDGARMSLGLSGDGSGTGWMEEMERKVGMGRS